ncbi:RNA polymerase sigma factor [Aquihabitans sp. McL0605]|uniref:RNA polymerase sigma factor n=1 Tax=Aquihabitans sp. McL0605 TaxID=3415671 RepID=UPI003CF84666
MSDEGGFEDWYGREHARLVTSLTMVTGDRDQAEDIAAEAFARCLERWDSERQPTNPSAWTYTVAINLLRRRWRYRQRESAFLAAGGAPVPEEIDDPAIELWRAVGSLSKRARMAVALRYIGGLTEREVADAMSIAPGTVAATLSRARADLADRLRSEGLDPVQPAPSAPDDGRPSDG